MWMGPYDLQRVLLLVAVDAVVGACCADSDNCAHARGCGL